MEVAEIQRSHSAELAAARAGKQVTSGETSEMAPARTSRSGLKRSSRGSPGDGTPQVVVEHDDAVRTEVNCPFSFNYSGKGTTLTVDPFACGEFSSRVPGDFDRFPPSESLLDVDACRDCALRQIQAVSSMNCLVSIYEVRHQKDVDALVEATEKAEAEAKATRRQRARANKLKKKYAELEATLADERRGFASEKKRWESLAQPCRQKINLLSRHIRSIRGRDTDRLMLCQVKGTAGCLKAMASDGSTFEDRLRQLTDDTEFYRKRLAEIPLVACADDELEFFPEFDSAEERD